jgi:hypothetical protein
MEGQLTFHAETNLVIFWLLYARFFSARKASATPRKVVVRGQPRTVKILARAWTFGMDAGRALRQEYGGQFNEHNFGESQEHRVYSVL